MKIIKDNLFNKFKEKIFFSPLNRINEMKKKEIPVDYFQFYNAVSSVYSSKIEGENIDFDSFYKKKFLKVNIKKCYTKRAEDLYLAYKFINNNNLTFENVKTAHSLLSANLLAKSEQGVLRKNPMFVLNSEDLIEYVATEPNKVQQEIEKLFYDIDFLLKKELNEYEIFYYASFIHLIFVKIHPFQDGNGRTARLIEKWFLIEKFGDKAISIKLEKNYFLNLNNYYSNIKKLGLEYHNLNYNKSLDFLLMTINSIKTNKNNKK